MHRRPPPRMETGAGPETLRPPLRPAVCAVLERARALSADAGCGYVGIEHVVEALSPTERGRLARLAGQDIDVVARWGALAPQADGRVHPEGTPRLRALLEELDIASGVDGLLEALAELPPVLLGCADPTRPDAWRTLVMPGNLEVLGGPEDGRVLRLDDGDSVGRNGRDHRPDHALYEGHALTDPWLEERALIWLGQGHVLVMAPARLQRTGQTSAIGPGALRVFADDVLELTDGTWLGALP